VHRDAVEAMSTMVQSSAGEAGEAGKASERVGAVSEHVRRVRSEGSRKYSRSSSFRLLPLTLYPFLLTFIAVNRPRLQVRQP
jgi:hypothetical protein